MKFKKGDQVAVTGGKDRGKRGKIERVNPKAKTVTVLGINLYKRHVKRRDDKQPGGIIDFPRPLPVGNVALICPRCKKLTRIGVTRTGGERHRVCRKCGGLL